MNLRQSWIDQEATIPISLQCSLASVSRSTFYAGLIPVQIDENELELFRLIDEEYTLHPFYGSRRMVVVLKKAGYDVNRKRIQRIMRKMGLAGIAPGPSTSKAHPDHKVYPYLLRGVAIVRPNQVWGTDITYIRLAHGFAYLVAVMDWYSRRVLSWRISNTLDAGFCVDCLEEAIRIHGKPEIFNSDQGSQFTCGDFVGILQGEDITISMDGRGRAFDNIFVERLWRSVKYEDIYLKDYSSMSELQSGLKQYFTFYNEERPHQSLGNLTPDDVYCAASGGGAMIVERYPAAGAESAVPLRSTADSAPAKKETEEEVDEASTRYCPEVNEDQCIA